MHPQSVQGPIRIVAAVCLCAYLASPPARGDITSANWVNNTLFHYRVTHMPDLDQKRHDLLDAFGVDCNGTIHCVPTCATNMVAYAANHGFPSLSPGPGYWEGQGLYNLATDTIQEMGEEMLTNCASGGTGGGNANAGLADWLAGQPGLVLNDHLSIGNFSPTHASIGQSLCAGRIGSVSYGRYDVVGDFKGIPLVDRNGGHCTTAVKVRRNGATREMWVRDPASDEGDNTIQSPFFNNIWTVTDLTVIVMPDIEMKVMTAINYTPGDDVIRLIDGHRTITPAQCYSWDSFAERDRSPAAGGFPESHRAAGLAVSLAHRYRGASAGLAGSDRRNPGGVPGPECADAARAQPGHGRFAPDSHAHCARIHRRGAQRQRVHLPGQRDHEDSVSRAGVAADATDARAAAVPLARDDLRRRAR